MKRIFLALLAVVAMVACEDKTNEQIPNKEPELPETTTETTTKYNFAFNSKGECYSQSVEGIGEDVFTAEIINHGWEQVELHEIFDNGNVEYADYWEERDGGGIASPFYIDNTVLTQYLSTTAYPPGEDMGYRNYDYTFEDSAIRINTTMNIEDKNIPMYRILEVDTDLMICIEFIGISGYNNKKIFGLAAYRRMSAEELEECRQKYTQNWSEE